MSDKKAGARKKAKTKLDSLKNSSLKLTSSTFKNVPFSRRNLVLFSVAFALIGGFTILKLLAAGPPTPMPLISRSKPAFASSGTASNANDASYDTAWRSSGTISAGSPAWLAYDLSTVPSAQRAQVYVGWYNDPVTYPYDHVFAGEVAYNSIKDYTIQGNPAAGGGSAPTTGWVTLATVTGNKYHSRSHLVDMTGDNWIRINVTAPDGSSGNNDALLNMDVHDAHNGAIDSWDFLGDSVTANAMGHTNSDQVPAGTKTYSELINNSNSTYYPAYEEAGIGGTTSLDMATNINTWLALFPGHYVGLSYGANDATGCASTTNYYNNYVTAINAITAAGKVPVIPTMHWAPAVNSCGQGFVDKVNLLYTNFPAVIHGPDLWTYFKNNPSLISGDGLHPSSAGNAALRTQWRDAMLANVYNVAGDTTAPVISSVASSNVTSTSATVTWTTNESADSQVEYGTTTSYGTSTTLDTSLVTSHSVAVTGLSASTLYHYRVKSKDGSANLATGSDNTFTTSAAASSSGVTVSGNQLLKDGQPFIFHGVNRSGSEFACIQGFGIFDSDVDTMNDDSQVPLMKSWGINSVLIPINEDCWLGINGVPAAYAGANYINAIKHEVATLEANGMVPIISLMWTASGTAQALDHASMVDNSHGPAVWQSMANTFKTDPYVVLRLKQEPHNIGDDVAGWQCLMLGDVQYDTSNTLTPISSTSHCSTGFPALGMQSMINIVRGTGANNVIGVSGTEYSNSMTHFMDAGIRPSDPLTVDQLMATVDTYPFGNTCGNVTCYNTYYAPVAAAMPFTSGEVGEDPNCARTTMTEVDTFLTWLDQHNSGYLAWAWDTWGGSCELISSYTTGAAQSPWGVDYKNHLAGLGSGADTTAPTTSITAPAANASVHGTTTVSANAADNVGVVGVQFKLDGANLLTEDTTSPYSISWDTTTATAGAHTLTTTARDAAGNSTTSTSVAVTVDNTAPTVSVTAPAGGATLRGSSVTVSANASDNNSVAGVQFKLDGANLSAEDTTSPYSITWNTTTATNAAHTLTATARDAAGNTTTSSSVSVTVDNSAPTVSVSAPAANAALRGASTTISATATDNVGVAGVQFQLDGANLQAEDTSSPYSITWDTTTATNGAHTLTAIARDAAGNTTTSASVAVTVDNIAPTVSITAPTAGASLRGNAVSVSASASDNSAVANVQFKLDGANLNAADTTSPYSTTWDTTTATNGAHTLTATAADNAGNTTTSASVSVTVDNSAPTVSLSSPAAGAVRGNAVTVSATASDNVAVAGVQFKLDGANLQAEDTSSPYSLTWDTTTAAAGTHTLSATARDAAGNTTTSATITVTVDNTAPTVSMATPSAGNTVSGANVTVSANASDNSGGSGVAGVQFYLDYAGNPASNKVGAEDITSPYSIAWNTTTLADGSHTLTAIARDAAGNTTTSATITITVDNTSPPPADTTAPTTPTGLSSPSKDTSSISLAWSASSDTGGSGLAGYYIYRNGASTPTATILVGGGLSYLDSSLSAGTTYSYKISAYDNAGNESAQSAAISVTTDAVAPTTCTDPAATNNGGPLPCTYPTSSPPKVAGDCDNDTHVRLNDLSILLSHYGSNYSQCDFGGSANVDLVDLSILLSNYGK